MEAWGYKPLLRAALMVWLMAENEVARPMSGTDPEKMELAQGLVLMAHASTAALTPAQVVSFFAFSTQVLAAVC